MTKQPPQITPEQRMAALEKANIVRKERSELKLKLKNGDLTLAQLFEMAINDTIASKIKVISALESIPGCGKIKAKRIMEEFSIASNRRVGGLGEIQKADLVSFFESNA